MTIDRAGRRPLAPHPHRATARWLTGLVVVGLMSPVSLFAQPRLYVQAVDSLDAIVTALGRDAIIVRENGVERRVVDVRPANLLMKITILVDNSQLTSNAYVQIREGVHRVDPHVRRSASMARPPHDGSRGAREGGGQYRSGRCGTGSTTGSTISWR